jgi:dihydropteroate synthase
MKQGAASESGASSAVSMPEGILREPFVVMGIVNVTPDSFFDGGKHSSVSGAVDHALRLVGEGAAIIDIGGQSTRPGASLIDWREECDRVLPVIEALVKKTDAPVSVDTMSSRTAAAALDAGARIINDVSAGRFDRAMPSLAAGRKCPVILMHSRRTPADMREAAVYGDVVAEVKEELGASVRDFMFAGVAAQDIIVDPGIGFAKLPAHNRELLRRMGELVAMGFPVCVGTSRKSFIGRLCGKGPEGCLAGSLASITIPFRAGAKMFRVHDVAETVQFLTVLHALYE